MFDTNGNAKETIVVTVYGYSIETMEFTGRYDVRVLEGTGIPGHSTLLTPPEVTHGKSIIFNGIHWEYIDDHRGDTVYSTSTGESSQVTYLGDIKPGYTLIKPSTPYDAWDGTAWVTDLTAQHAANVELAEQKKSVLLSEAQEKIGLWQTELQLGMITDSDKAALIIWMTYIKAVQAVDTSAAPDIAWPPKPAG
ncbi:prophage tail fiber assembly protein [Edwardsiella phage EPP-1]|uniref:tail fiber assembly protein n=1 Tax=Edwardsiella piscicida TaxID=1263550 RepID=UPI001F310551|nr:tail fiber assembly protein [Edwardsiella piscicida]UJT80216.1 tail fiber assembly protein [Edwardsiella piscicida]WJN66839.1 prophage tail fiber assembly protein [Edwardsiella phage EPP-1]